MEQFNRFKVRFPEKVAYEQAGEEYFFLKEEEKSTRERKIMLHDYETIYKTSMLYEYVLFEKLQYQSHTVLTSTLSKLLGLDGNRIAPLSILEVGAGTGCVGYSLKEMGAKSVTAIDIIPEAAEAANRDYPKVYDKYYIEDFAQPSKQAIRELEVKNFDMLICCSAFGHMPQSAFINAFNLIDIGGWIVFNVPKNQWENTDDQSIKTLHPWIMQPEIFELHYQNTYRHRYRCQEQQEEVEYVGLIGCKKANIPTS